jgi:hypothetical protein
MIENHFARGRDLLHKRGLQLLAEAGHGGHPRVDPLKALEAADITAWVKPGENILEIAVANLWNNRIVGDSKDPDLPPVARTNFKKNSTPSPPCRRPDCSAR